MYRYVLQPNFPIAARAMSRLAYLDKGAMVLNKPPGLVCQFDHSSSKNVAKLAEENTYGPFLKDIQASYNLSEVPMPLHRLDKMTTGALLFGLSESVARDLSRQFQARTVQKDYLAIVRGGRKSFESTDGTIYNFLEIDDGRVSVASADTVDRASDKTAGQSWKSKRKGAITEWELVASSSTVPLSLVRLTLRTGVKHQLRVHMAHTLQVPILGDTLYSKSKLSNKITDVVTIPEDAMYLHASSLSLDRYSSVGPHKKHRIRVIASLPKYFTGLCHKIGIALDRDAVKGGVWDNGEVVPRSAFSLQRFSRVEDLTDLKDEEENFELAEAHIPGGSVV